MTGLYYCFEAIDPQGRIENIYVSDTGDPKETILGINRLIDDGYKLTQTVSLVEFKEGEQLRRIASSTEGKLRSIFPKMVGGFRTRSPHLRGA